MSVFSYWLFLTDEINQKILWTINIVDFSWWHKFMSGKCYNLKKKTLLYVNKFQKYAHFAMCLSGFTYTLYKNDSIKNRNHNVKMENIVTIHVMWRLRHLYWIIVFNQTYSPTPFSIPKIKIKAEINCFEFTLFLIKI